MNTVCLKHVTCIINNTALHLARRSGTEALGELICKPYSLHISCALSRQAKGIYIYSDPTKQQLLTWRNKTSSCWLESVMCYNLCYVNINKFRQRVFALTRRVFQYAFTDVSKEGRCVRNVSKHLPNYKFTIKDTIKYAFTTKISNTNINSTFFFFV
jgi:hypothetical protein